MAKRGVMFFASGKRSLEEVKIAIASVRKHHPELPILLFTSDENHGVDVEYIRPSPMIAGYHHKLKALSETIFEETLFLDADVYVCRRLDALFELMDMGYHFGSALAIERDSYRNFNKPESVNSVDAPDTYQERNGGVLVYRQCPETRELWEVALRHCEELFATNGGGRLPSGILRMRDQLPLRYALCHTKGLREVIFPREWNCLLAQPQHLKGWVHVIHFHLDDLKKGYYMPDAKTFEELERLVNKTANDRLVLPCFGIFSIPPTTAEAFVLAGRLVSFAVKRILIRIGLMKRR